MVRQESDAPTTTLTILLAGVLALGCGLVLQPLVLRGLLAKGVLDQPSARSSHSTPTPRGGGVAVAVALVLGTLSLGSTVTLDIALLLLVVVLAGGVGLAEDLHGVRVVPRLALLAGACTPLCVGAFDQGAVGPLLAAAVVLFALAVINATNFMDGINGISAAQGVGTGVAYAVLAWSQGLDVLAATAAATAGAALSFVPYNAFPRCRVFLGDSGSYALGAAYAALAILLWDAGLPVEAVIAPLAVYAADTGTTLLRRYSSGERLHEPHRTHVYQRLTDVGMEHLQVSVLVLVLVLVCSALGTVSLTTPLPRILADIVLVLLLVGYLQLPRLLSGSRLATARSGPADGGPHDGSARLGA